MHNNRIKGKWLAVLAVLLPCMAWAQVPPPVVRNVLDTNFVSFGTTGQALFRTAASPYLNWSNVTQQAIDTNAFQPASTTLSNLSGTGAITNAPWTNSYQPGSSILTNLSGTGALTNFAPITVPTRLVFEGDSTSLLGAPSYPYWLTQVYGLTNGLWCWGTNAASNTATLTNIISEYVGQIQPWKPSGGTNAILFLWAGINDLAAGASSNDVVRDVSNYCATARADGFKVCLLTIGRSAGVADAGRVGANEALRFGGFADWVVDAGRMFPPPSATASVTNYYIDVTHLNTNAQRLLAAAVRDTLFSDDQRGVRYDPWADGNVDALAAISLRPGSMLSIGNFISGTKSLEVYGQPAYFQPSLHSDSTISGFLQSIWYNGINASGGSNLMAGNLGLGTNIPQSRLHVTADNSVPYVAQFGTTNRPQLSLWDTNGNQTLTGWLSQTSGTNYGDAAKTNWTTASTATGNDFLVTNTAGGSVRVVNGNLLASGRLGIGTNNPQALLEVVGTNSGNGYLFRVSSWTLPHSNTFTVDTNGSVTSRGSYSSQSTISGSRFEVATTSGGMRVGTGSANNPYLRNSQASLSSWEICGGAGVGSPSNNLFIAGQCIASNGMVAKIHSTYGPSTNIVPLTVIPNSGSGTNIFEVQDTNGVQCFVVDSNNFVGIGTNLPAAPLHIVSTNVSGKLFVVQSNTSGTATLIVTNGRVGIGKNNPAYMMDVSGQCYAGTGFISGGYVNVAGTSYLIWNGNSRMYSKDDGYINIVNSAATDCTGIILGTNSTVAPASGPTNAAPMLKKARQFSTPATHVPGFKLTDQSDGTNGCFLELKSVSSANTNKLVPETASVIHFATTNGTPDGKAEGWIVEENGKMYRTRPCGFGALMNDTSNTVVCAGAAGVYTNMAGTAFTTIVTNDFTGGKQAISAGLTNVYAGYYRIFINASYLGGNSTTYEFDVTTNGVICDLIEVKNTTDNPARFRTSSAGGIIYLPANCGVQMMVQDGGSGSTINVFRSSLTIGTP